MSNQVKTKRMKGKNKNTLIIGASILALAVIGALVYYYFFFHQKEEKQEVKPIEKETLKEAFEKGVSYEDKNNANISAYQLLRKRQAELGKIKQKILVNNGGSMTQNALDNQVMFDNAKAVREQTGVIITIKPKDETKGEMVHAV